MDYRDLTWKEFFALVTWDGEDQYQLIQDMTGLDYDLCMDQSIELNFTLNEVFEYLNGLQPDSLYIDMVEINMPDVIDGLFGEKMVLNQIYQAIGLSEKPEQKLIELIPVIVAIYATRQYKGRYTEKVFKELCNELKGHKINSLYPIAMSLIEGLNEANTFQEKAFKIDPMYVTKSSAKRAGKLKNAGMDRLNKFGDMNEIDNFVELFPAYKHDDVFELDFRFVIQRLERNLIKNNISENLIED